MSMFWACFEHFFCTSWLWEEMSGYSMLDTRYSMLVKRKHEIRSTKSPSSEVELLRRTGETNSNDRNTNPPKADKIQNKEGTDWSAFCPKTKNSLPFLDTDSHRINTVFFLPQRTPRPQRKDKRNWTTDWRRLTQIYAVFCLAWCT